MKDAPAVGHRLWGAAMVALVLTAGAPAASPAEQAGKILESAGVKGGLIVHVGCGDGKLTAALRAGENYLVHGLDTDRAAVAKARAYIGSLGLYGDVSVEAFDGKALPYADNTVNLLVSDDLGDVTSDEVMRVLAPLGVSYIGGKKTVKPRPETIDEWTHWLHDASGNAVAKDSTVGPPRRLQWVEGPRWQRHHEFNASPNAMVSSGGRIFYICDEAAPTISSLPDQWVLIARDAFNGVLLWKRPIQQWGWKAWSPKETGGRFNVPVFIPRRLVAVGDRVYVTLGFNAPLTSLDAANGKIVKTYEGTQFTDEITFRRGVLILSVNKAGQSRGLIGTKAPVKKQIVAIEADSGKVLWRAGDYVGISSKSDSFERITHLSLAVGAEEVAFLEEDVVAGLDVKTGKELWRTPRPEKKPKQGHVPYKPPNLCTLVIHKGVVLLAQGEEPYTRKTWTRGVKCVLTGMSAKTGKVLWTQPCSKWGPGVKADVFAIGDLVWTHAADRRGVIGIDLRSGEIKRKFSTEAVFKETHHHRCYRNKATEKYLLTARRGIELIDLAGGKVETSDKNHWVRGACRYGIMPCNGLIYAPPDPCKCYIDVKLNGFYALGPASAKPPPTAPSGRTEYGGAYERTGDRKSAIVKETWPTYRGNIERSGATETPVPTDIKRLWQADLGGPLSACTAAGSLVFVASIDRHRVCALDAKDGKVVWSYTAGGRVDTPPTIYNGLAIFGSADGWVYCLRASDGELIWRFRAAPRERRVVAFGRLESVWPVHGTVLVKEGAAYVAAGRSTYLDGGISVYAIKPETGEVIRKLQPLNGPHGLEDVLVSGGKFVYMRKLKFSLSAEGREDPASSRKKTAKGRKSPPVSRAFTTAGMLDKAYFSRVGWGGGAELAVLAPGATYYLRTRRTGSFNGWFKPGTGAYQLIAMDKKLKKPRWSKTVAIRVRAMVSAGGVLFAAGPPDVVDKQDPWAAIEGRKGAVMRAMSADDGKKLAEYKLDAPPIYDGLIAAGGRLYITTTDGKVVCMGK